MLVSAHDHHDFAASCAAIAGEAVARETSDFGKRVWGELTALIGP